MPVFVGDSSTISEHNRFRRPRNQPISETDPNPPQIPSITQSTRCKSTITSLLLSTFTTTTTTTTNDTATATPKKKNFPSGPLRGLGCAAASSSQVSMPAVIRTSANWEAKKVRKKKQRKQNREPPNHTNPSSSADVWCGPGIGFTTDVDCVVSRRTVPGRLKVDSEKMNPRERPSYSARRMVNPEPLSFMDDDHSMGMMHSGLDVFGARYHRHFRHSSPEGLAEIMMLHGSMLMGGRSDGFDRYRDWRLDVDNMSYEELLELGDRIGHVNTGLKEDEIVHCLRETKLLDNSVSQFPTEMEWKCSICQEDYEADDEMGKLECGHFYHIDCIKQWLVQKNTCPICKTAAASQ
ncbi:putative E3 ubiquitin-protein ligase RHG1A [Camellia lanceoleosa]|uniref:E3 ubiquitin-protein ligase RHG1A n=1 Tax=Camellia lanceoleosa TaxID=1840588 RepID=A0ACC0FDA5_9ERIC|nr:putative E3 ubiquitin-protein ligase RHG1A [Camellia lanceoleosa]